MTQQPTIIRELVGVADPNHSTNAIPNTMAVNTDGSINVISSSSGTFEASAVATTAAPTYVDTTVNALSQNLTGDLRVIAKQSTSPWITSQSLGATFNSTPVTVPSSSNGIIVLAANASRKSATIYNPGLVNVYVSQTNAVTTGNGYIPPGTALNITDYSGAIYGIVATSTQAVSVMETST